ncbi:hypothetical protein V5O48_016742 [Marasmius crinis-equi]|uniref:Phosphoglycerate mutase n=1 Tax=Marasmius crinis-equi TaxID=585013 RepID=A0ABR3EQV7_9AGAR
MLTVTFIRHGESEDNTVRNQSKSEIFSGFSNQLHRRNGSGQVGKMRLCLSKQAAAAGKYFSTTPFTAIYASPLLRAYQTAEGVRDASQHPKLPINKNPHLREQHFGIAEGKPWEAARDDTYSTQEEAYANGVYPALVGRNDRFPEGESLNDLGKRAAEAIQECVIPHLQGENPGGHIILASHGLCISELIPALLRLDPDADVGVDYRGLLNTAWTRVVVSFKDPSTKSFDASNPPPLNVKITDVNVSTHLDEVVRFSAIKQRSTTLTFCAIQGAIPVKTADLKQAFFAGKADVAQEAAAGEKL